MYVRDIIELIWRPTGLFGLLAYVMYLSMHWTLERSHLNNKLRDPIQHVFGRHCFEWNRLGSCER